MKSKDPELRRSPSRKVEVRKNADGTRTASGYFATFGTRSKPMGFTEVIAPGAFNESLRNNECRALVNHNPDALLGIQRTDGTGNLKVAEDKTGLRFSVDLPDTSYARDLSALMDDGIVDQCSFAFSVPDGGDRWDEVDGELVRTLTNVTLYEGSILMSEAAYPGTSADIRSCTDSCPVNLRHLLRAKTNLSEDDPAIKSKKKMKREDFDYDDDELDAVCDPDSDSYDPEFDAAGYCDTERMRKASIRLSLARLKRTA